MGITETAIIYLIVGVVIAAAMALRSEEHRSARILLHAACWPFFAPYLLASPAEPVERPLAPASINPRLRTAEERLLASIGTLDGVVGEVLAPEIARIHRLMGALAEVDRRIGEMDTLLATPEFDRDAVEHTLASLRERGCSDADPRIGSVESRRRNIDRLLRMRDQAREDLERAILKMEEMSAQILVLRFAERPEAALVDLVREVATTVEGVCERLISV